MTAFANINELGFFTGIEQYQNFSNLKNILECREMRASATPFEFPEAPRIDLPETYEFEGEQKRLSALLEETRTGSLLVLRAGKVVYENYSLTGGRDVQWLSMSVAKSFISALVGIAIAEGKIGSVDDPVDRYVPGLDQSAYRGVSIKNVLQMSSGARWDEDYSNPQSDVMRLGAALAPGGSLDAFVASVPNESPAGTVCRYNSADTQLLGMLLSHATGTSISDYMQSRICEPLGFEAPGFWILDGAGREMAFAGLNLTARDFAKLGELFRLGGVWGGQQIVPADYVRASIRADAPHLETGKPIVGDHPLPFGYGYQWWLTGENGDFSGIGVYNQFVYVSPVNETVIVKSSANPLYGTSNEERTQRDAENVAALKALSAQAALGG